jgi:hypothetical protein
VGVHVSGAAAGFWTRRTALFTLGFLLLAALLGLLLWRFFAGGPAAPPVAFSGMSAPPATSPCAPRTPSQATRPTDGYDRAALSLNPVLYLPLADPASGLAADLSGSHRQAFYETAGRQLGVARLPNGDKATVFDGAGQYVDVPSADSLSITRTGCLTVVAWVRPDVLQFPQAEGSGYVYLLGKGATGKHEYALRMYSHSTEDRPPRPNRVSAYVFNLRGGLGSGAYFQDTVKAGEWMMLAFTVDSRSSANWPDGYVAIYKNGKRRGDPVSLGQFDVKPGASDAPLRIATRDLKSFFAGAMGKVAVYDSLLTDQQLHAMYTAMTAGGS